MFAKLRFWRRPLASPAPKELAELRQRRERATLRLLEIEQSVLERRPPEDRRDDRQRERA